MLVVAEASTAIYHTQTLPNPSLVRSDRILERHLHVRLGVRVGRRLRGRAVPERPEALADPSPFCIHSLPGGPHSTSVSTPVGCSPNKNYCLQ